MGGAWSAPPSPPPVDLLPPRFDRRVSPLERLPVSPFETAFGVEKRDRLLTGYYAAPDTVSVAASLRPDYEQQAQVGVAASAPLRHTATAGAASAISFAYTDALAKPALHVQARLGTDGTARALIAAAFPDQRLAVYGLLPGEWLMAGGTGAGVDVGAGAGAGAASRARATSLTLAPLGFGLGGAPTRLTHWRESMGSRRGAPTAAAAAAYTDGAASDPVADFTGAVVSPSAVSAPPMEAGAGVGMAGTRIGASPSLALPELGVRYMSANSAVLMGLHTSPFPPYPTKAWMMASVNGAVTAGVQVAASGTRLASELQRHFAAGDAVTATAVTATAAGAAAAAASTSLGPASSLGPALQALAIDAAISLAQAPLYEVSLAYDGTRREVVAGYVHNMTVRRRVHNPLEADHVKGIYNYVDLGFELRRPVAVPAASSIAVGASWQLNKGVLVKGRVGTRDVSVTAAWKGWWDPAVTAAATYTYDRLRDASGVGFFFSLEKGGEVQYQKAVQGYHDAAQSRLLVAQEQLSASRESVVDVRPFDPPPVGSKLR